MNTFLHRTPLVAASESPEAAIDIDKKQFRIVSKYFEGIICVRLFFDDKGYWLAPLIKKTLTQAFSEKF